MDGDSRPTTASIDRRVERLELAQAETDRKVDQVALKMEYMSELMSLKFSSMESSQSAMGSKLDTFMTKIDALIAEGMKQASDLRAMPLGRQVDDRLLRLEQQADQAENFISQARGFGGTFRLYVLPVLAMVVAITAVLVRLGE